MIRVVLPAHLKTLAKVQGEVTFEIAEPRTIGAVLDAIEERFPMLCGTIRDRATKRRRAFVRYFACERDLSHLPTETLLPPAVVDGNEPFLVVGAMAGG